MNLKIVTAAILLACTVQTGFAQTGTKSDKIRRMVRDPKCCPESSTTPQDYRVPATTTDIPNADMGVASLTVETPPEGYIMHATVSNMHDDCSACTHIIVVLPVDVKVNSFSAVTGDGASLKVVQCMGQLRINVGQTCPSAHYEGDTVTYIKDVNLTVNTSKMNHTQYKATFGVFVHSKVPDLHADNNYKSWIEP